MTRLAALLALAGAALAAVPAATGQPPRECDGHRACVPVAGPWVLVPPGADARRPTVEYQLTCPRGHVVGGVDAELSHRAIDVRFLGTLGSPVNPGISTRRAVVFRARYVGPGARAPSFRPRAGCIPATGAGTRIPTAAAAFPPGESSARRVETVRVRPGTSVVTRGCRARERLVGAGHALGFYRQAPPGPSLAGTLSDSRAVRGNRVVVIVRADAELGGVRAVVQVHALCAAGR